MFPRNDESQDDILKDARTLFEPEESFEVDEHVTYGPLTLSIAPKEGKANTLLADQLFSPALYLAERIERRLIAVDCRAVIELGAGCALPSLLAATLPEPPSLVVVTDYPDDVIMTNLKRNVESNRAHITHGCQVKIMGYEWGKDASDLLQLLPGGYNVVILSDLLHFNKSHGELVESMKQLLSDDLNARAYISAGKYTADRVCEQFIEIAHQSGFLIEEVCDDSVWQGSVSVGGLDQQALTLRKRNCRFWIGKKNV